MRKPRKKSVSRRPNLKWLLGLLLVATGCVTRPPRTIEQAQQQYQRNKARTRGNPTLVPYFPK